MIWSTTYLIITNFAALTGALSVNLPNVTLPWGTYQATLYDPEGDFYTFRNVRFGKAPIGELRFSKSVFPDQIDDPSQLQLERGAPCHSATVPAPSTAAFGPVPRLLPGLPRSPAEQPSEDCLFADVYVPASALTVKKVPIVVWLYGGGFIFGAKDAGYGEYNMPFYNATGLLRTAHSQKQDFIFMTGNYRLGAFGWLAGPTMEQYGTPNAGLWDQRLLLDFAQQYLPNFGGDENDIGLWGESAGAGSILHHLTSTEPPVFSRALLQSPAFLWQWDRTELGHAGSIFKNLTTLAGCPSTGVEAVSCLRNLTDTSLQQLNQAIVAEEMTNTGLIPFNPAVDGKLIKQLPTNALREGAFWKNISSLVISHVADESSNFIPPYIHDEPSFQRFLSNFLRGEAHVPHRANITARYANTSDPILRAKDIIADSSFLCNTRHLFDAYHPTNSTALHMMQYSFLDSLGAAVHASDLLPTFLNTDVPEEDFVAFFRNFTGSGAWKLKWLFGVEQALAKQYQPYLASFGGAGNVSGHSPEWKVARNGEKLGDVMKVTCSLWPVIGEDMDAGTTDEQTGREGCEFWADIAGSLERSEGDKKEGWKLEL